MWCKVVSFIVLHVPVQFSQHRLLKTVCTPLYALPSLSKILTTKAWAPFSFFKCLEKQMSYILMFNLPIWSDLGFLCPKTPA